MFSCHKFAVILQMIEAVKDYDHRKILEILRGIENLDSMDERHFTIANLSSAGFALKDIWINFVQRGSKCEVLGLWFDVYLYTPSFIQTWWDWPQFG